MTRDEVLGVLRAHKATLGQRFGVTELALFGSFARDQAAGDSDVDVLVRFGVPPDWELISALRHTWKISWGDRWIWQPARIYGWRYAPTWNGR